MTTRRGNGEGHIKKNKNNTYTVKFMCGYKDNGKKNIISITRPTKAEVLEEMRRIKMEYEKSPDIDRNITLGEFADIWYKDFKGSVEESTYSGYKYTLKKIKDGLGNISLNDLKPMHINRFLQNIIEVYADSYIRKIKAMLVQICDYADDNGMILRNPARHCMKMKKLSGNKKAKKDSFSEKEISILYDKLPNNLLGNSIKLQIGSGLRSQELLALKKEDISADGSKITVNKAIKTVDGKSMLGPPKNNQSYRTIPIPEDYRKYAIYLRENGADPFIWSLSMLNPLCSVSTYRKKFKKALKEITGVRMLTPHCCRHTYVTRLQARGVPMETIARLAGHSDVETTDEYLHTSSETLEKAVSTLNFKEVA